MYKKIMVLFILIFFMAGFAYGQGPVYKGDRPSYMITDLPMPVDPDKGGEMELSAGDMQLKKNADAYYRQDNYKAAIAEVNKMSSEWARHSFLSYIYERTRQYNEVLTHIDWMIARCNDSMTKQGLKNRRNIIANMAADKPKTKAYFY